MLILPDDANVATAGTVHSFECVTTESLLRFFSSIISRPAVTRIAEVAAWYVKFRGEKSCFSSQEKGDEKREKYRVIDVIKDYFFFY